MRHEDVMPVDNQQRRNPDASKVEAPSRELGEIEQIDYHFLGETEQLCKLGVIRDIGNSRNGFLHQFTVFEQAQGDEGIDFRPDPLLFKKSQATERRPTTGLAPQGDTDHIGDFAQF